MKSPEEFDRGPFEESWKEAFEGKGAIPPKGVWDNIVWKNSFEGKELNPPAHVWENIVNELHPAAASIPFYKTSMWRYGMAAAFTLLLGISAWFQFGNTVTEPAATELAELQSPEEASLSLQESIGANPNTLMENLGNSASGSIQPNNVIASASPENEISIDEIDPSIAGTTLLTDSKTESLLAQEILSNQAETNFITNTDQVLNVLANLDFVDLNAESSIFDLSNGLQSLENLQSNPALALLELPKPNQFTSQMGMVDLYPMPKGSNIGLKNPNRGMYTQFNVSTGEFNPNFSMQEEDFLNAYSLSRFVGEGSISVPTKLGEVHTPETSLQVGWGVGFIMGKHFTIETGISYANHTTISSSNIVASPQHFSWEKPVTVALTNEDRIKPQMQLEITNAYDIRNSFQFLSVPMHFAFTVPVNKFNITLRSGATANLFTGGDIMDPSGRLRAENFRPGSSSPYQTFMLQGMVGGELGYRINSMYTLAFQGGYNFSFTDMAKPDSFFQSRPNQLGVGFAVRYHLPRF